jgi:acetyl-CoA carboxylase carboxyltransferase component
MAAPNGDSRATPHEGETLAPLVERFNERREVIRREMGGIERIAKLHAGGRRTIRDRIEAFVDPGSFEELGTFSRSENPLDAASTPGDGKIGGHATVDGRPVTVIGDDITVKRGSSSVVGGARVERLFEHALKMGNPFVCFGETGGARIPDTIGGEGFLKVTPKRSHAVRRHRIPMVTAIVGESFGGSSFMAAMSDFVVQVRGSCLAVTSPRVVEVATGEQVSFEDLGGVDVHARVTGQIDLGVETEDEAIAAIRAFLSYLPSNGWTPPPRGPSAAEIGHSLDADPALATAVPARRRRAYDMRAVLARVVDGGQLFELRPLFGRSLITAFARIDGHPVGVIASQPVYQAGVLSPDACDKATKMVVLCDSYGLPLVFLQDVPGFLVGTQVEHNRLLHKAIHFQEALALAAVPKLTVVLRKAFGLAYFLMGGTDSGADLVCAWPSAELGFMDPAVGANVLAGTRLASLDDDARREALAVIAAEVEEGTDPFLGAGIMKIDEIIDPADTRGVLARALGRFAHRPFEPGADRPLASWPTCW